MTEQYWRDHVERERKGLLQNELWRGVLEDLKQQSPGMHHLELHNICKSDNAFIRQVKASPGLTADGAAELICRGVGCDLQFCMLTQNKGVVHSRAP